MDRLWYDTEKALVLWKNRLQRLEEKGEDGGYFGGGRWTEETKKEYLVNMIARVEADKEYFKLYGTVQNNPE